MKRMIYLTRIYRSTVNKRRVFRVLVGKPEGKNHLGDLDVDGRIILRWIFRKWDMGYGLYRAGPE